MEHAEALELIELAAVEPDGLERLMAGDTRESGAVAGHLAGCPACVVELARIRRTAAVVREAIVALPDPALRERTLAFVREVGRDRSGAGVAPVAAGSSGGSVSGSTAGSAGSVAGPGVPPPAVVTPVPVRRASPGRWIRYAGIAAALAIAAGLGFGAASMRSQEGQLAYEVGILQATTDATLRVEAMPDARRVELVATAAASGASGTLLFSPSSGEVVMIATGLSAPAPGEEYGCWVEVDGTRTRIGRMYQGGALQSWAGPVEGLADLPPGVTFGVSLAPVAGGAGEPVLTGS
jgi:hypothetical protein